MTRRDARQLSPIAVLLSLLLLPATSAHAQDAAFDADFTLGSLPTSLRIPDGKWAFRLTHRFSRAIGEGSAKDFFADAFGFDSSAKVGFELRYGLWPGTQVSVHRTNDRTIQFLGQKRMLSSGGASPWTIDMLAGVEGRNNFGESYATSIGGILAKAVGAQAAFYVHPFGVINVFDDTTNPPPTGPLEKRNTFVLGLGARVRLGASPVFLVAEIAPRIGGYHDGNHHATIAIERGVGGHMFQFNISNTFGTTLAQVARGGRGRNDWYIGFNLTRRFY